MNIEVGKLLGTNARDNLRGLPPCSSAPWQWLKKLPGTSQQVSPAHYHTDRATAAPRWASMGFGSVTLAPWISYFGLIVKSPPWLQLGVLRLVHVYVIYTACYQCGSPALTSLQVLMASFSLARGGWWSRPRPLTDCSMIHLDGDWLHIQFVSTPDQQLIIWNAWDVCAWEAWSAGACAGVAGKVINKGLSLAV